MADRGCKRRKQANPRRKNVDLEHMQEDAGPDHHVGMRPSLSSPPLNPIKGPLLPPSSEGDTGPLPNGALEDRPRLRMNGASKTKKSSPEEEKIQEYLQRSDTAVIYPEPVGGTSPRNGAEEKNRFTPSESVIEEPRVPSEYLLKCPHCEQVFSGQQAIHELKEHLSHSHKEATSMEGNFTCSKCNASFETKENLAKHKQFHNTNGQGSALTTEEDAALRKFKCTECGKAFKFKHHLKEHLRIHSGEKPHACPNCGKRFSHSGSYSSHMTSKKCLVVNLKVRKMDIRSPRGRGSTQNSFRPIIPKFRSSGVAGNGTAPPEMPLVPAGYMPSSERFTSFASRPQQPFLPLSFHPILANQPHYPHLSLGPFPEVTHLLQQRRFESDSEHHSHSQISSHLAPTSNPIEKPDSSPANSPKPAGEFNAVKKILEIVDATVTKQQKSPTRPRNGLLSELLSAAPNPIKSPTPFGASIDARCRFCSRLFDNKVDLHQHERYLCPHNGDSLKSPEIRHSDGESGEENRTSSLNVDCVLTLKAHCQINPRPKKSEIIRLSRDLKCCTRTVQEWFHSQQQMRAKDFNENLSPDPPASVVPQSNGHPFVPHFNGAISLGSALIPFRPIAERSPRLNSTSSQDDDQPLDLSFKSSDPPQEENNNVPSSPSSNHCDSEVLNLSQRSSRTPPKVSSPYPVLNNRHEDLVRDSSQGNLHSSLLYKYMQMGNSNHGATPSREKSPDMPSSPDRSLSHAEHPQSMSSPGGASYVDNSRSPSGTTGSYCCQTDELGDAHVYSLKGVKRSRMWNQGDGNESTLEDCPGGDENSAGSGKMRKSWKRHKVESEEGMYACDQCDKMFSKQSSLARHKYEHSGQRPHQCDLCVKAFKHKHHLTEHKRLHSGEKPYQCEKCLKKFSHSGSYSQHMNHRYSTCKPYHE